MARPTDFDLAKELARPGFTPGQRDIRGLLDLVVAGDEAVVARAAPALASLGEAARTRVLEQLGTVDEGAAARLVGVLGLVARKGDAPARAALIASLTEPRGRVRRAAAVALGKLGATASQAGGGDDLEDVRAALVARWDQPDVPADEKRALAEALGKVGGTGALARLEALDATADKELARRRDRALLVAEREAKRADDSAIATDVRPPHPLAVRLGCRPALAELLVGELLALGLRAKALRNDAVDVTLDGPWSTLFGSRLWASAAIRVPLRGGGERAGAIVDALVGSELRALMTAWTRGPIRWRLGVAQGHQRALIWQVAKEVRRQAPELVNDPTGTTWDLRLDADARALDVFPRRAPDPRFAYRVAEVPASSHPTVAAALAWVAEARAGDRVWDPFCGSGLELVERARRGPLRSLLGTDTDDAALAAARANLDAAGVTADLARRDARDGAAPGSVDLVITNPPLGSRVHVDAAALLVSALPGFARALAPGGRLVWITPAWRATSPAAEAAGLVLARSLDVDLGGVRGRLERWDRR